MNPQIKSTSFSLKRNLHVYSTQFLFNTNYVSQRKKSSNLPYEELKSISNKFSTSIINFDSLKIIEQYVIIIFDNFRNNQCILKDFFIKSENMMNSLSQNTKDILAKQQDKYLYSFLYKNIQQKMWWKKVFSIKNISFYLQIFVNSLNNIFTHNIEVNINSGIIDFKNQISQILKVQISSLIVDILRIINIIKKFLGQKNIDKNILNPKIYQKLIKLPSPSIFAQKIKNTISRLNKKDKYIYTIWYDQFCMEKILSQQNQVSQNFVNKWSSFEKKWKQIQENYEEKDNQIEIEYLINKHFQYFLKFSDSSDINCSIINIIIDSWSKLDYENTAEKLVQFIGYSRKSKLEQCFINLSLQQKSTILKMINYNMHYKIQKKCQEYCTISFRIYEKILCQLFKCNFNNFQNLFNQIKNQIDFKLGFKMIQMLSLNKYIKQIQKKQQIQTIDQLKQIVSKLIKLNEQKVKQESQINTKILFEDIINLSYVEIQENKIFIKQFIDLYAFLQVLLKKQKKKQLQEQKQNKIFQKYWLKIIKIIEYQNDYGGLVVSQINNMSYGLFEATLALLIGYILNLKTQSRIRQFQTNIFETHLKVLLSIIQIKLRNKQQQNLDNVSFKQMHQINIYDLQQKQCLLWLTNMEKQQLQNYSHELIKKIHKQAFNIKLQKIQNQQKHHQKKIKKLQLKNTSYIQQYFNDLIQLSSSYLIRQSLKKLKNIQILIITQQQIQAWKILKNVLALNQVKIFLKDHAVDHTFWTRIFISILQIYQSINFQKQLNNKLIKEQQIKYIQKQIIKQYRQQSSIIKKANIQKYVTLLDYIEKFESKKLNMDFGIQITDNQQLKQQKQLLFAQLSNYKTTITQFSKNAIWYQRTYLIKLQNQNQKQQFINQLIKCRQHFYHLRTMSIKLFDLHVQILIKPFEVQFSTLQQVISCIIQNYYSVLKCNKQYFNFKLYPFINSNSVVIKKQQDKYLLKLDFFQSHLFNLLIPLRQQIYTKYYKYPNYPFIHLSQQLNQIMKKSKFYQNNFTYQKYQFDDLISQMKSLCFQHNQQNSLKTIKQQILKQPYFWKDSQRFRQIVDTKQKMQSMINRQQCRRKQNIKTKQSLPKKQLKYFNSSLEQNRHLSYKPAYGYHQTAQHYLLIQGIIQKQAFEEDIGNCGTLNKQFDYDLYFWYNGKDTIRKIIDQLADREQKKWGDRRSADDRFFPSFQNHLRQLRNFLVHSVTRQQNGPDWCLHEKITLINELFPKFYIFINRWRCILGKDFFKQIKKEKVKFLKSIFDHPKEVNVIQKMQKNPHLKKYSMQNLNLSSYNKVQSLFNYPKTQKSFSCRPCVILGNSLAKSKSLWQFLKDIQSQTIKDGEDHSFNILFFAHTDKQGCNYAMFCRKAFKHVMKRKDLTAEQISFSENGVYDKNLSKKGDKEMSEEQLLRQFHQTDFLSKYFIYQLQFTLPLLFHDLRKTRYTWDKSAQLKLRQ